MAALNDCKKDCPCQLVWTVRLAGNTALGFLSVRDGFGNEARLDVLAMIDAV